MFKIYSKDACLPSPEARAHERAQNRDVLTQEAGQRRRKVGKALNQQNVVMQGNPRYPKKGECSPPMEASKQGLGPGPHQGLLREQECTSQMVKKVGLDAVPAPGARLALHPRSLQYPHWGLSVTVSRSCSSVGDVKWNGTRQLVRRLLNELAALWEHKPLECQPKGNPKIGLRI